MYITTTGIGTHAAGRRAVARARAARRSGDRVRRRSAITASPSCWPAATSTSKRTCCPTRGPVTAARRRARRRGRHRRPLDARPDARRRRDVAQRAGARLRTRRRADRGASAAARRPSRAPASCSVSIRCTSPTKVSFSPWSRPSTPTPRSRRCIATPGGEQAARHRRDPGRRRRAPCWSRRPTAAPGSSTCWSAIRCRGSADALVALVREDDSNAGHSGLTGVIETASWRDSSRSGCSAATPCRVRSSSAKRRRLARVCQAMAGRFLRGGRLLAFGRGRRATDAQHVSVEFVHPVDRRQARPAGARPVAALQAVAGRHPAARRHRHGLRPARRRCGGRRLRCDAARPSRRPDAGAPGRRGSTTRWPPTSTIRSCTRR